MPVFKEGCPGGNSSLCTPALCWVAAGVVKMRRGEVAKIMYHLDDHADTLILFRKSVGDSKEWWRLSSTLPKHTVRRPRTCCVFSGFELLGCFVAFLEHYSVSLRHSHCLFSLPATA